MKYVYYYFDLSGIFWSDGMSNGVHDYRSRCIEWTCVRTYLWSSREIIFKLPWCGATWKHTCRQDCFTKSTLTTAATYGGQIWNWNINYWQCQWEKLHVDLFRCYFNTLWYKYYDTMRCCFILLFTVWLNSWKYIVILTSIWWQPSIELLCF